jgi:hypothetical protein
MAKVLEESCVLFRSEVALQTTDRLFSYLSVEVLEGCGRFFVLRFEH